MKPHVSGDDYLEAMLVIHNLHTDPDGSVFKTVMDALQEKKAEVIDIAAPAPLCTVPRRIGNPPRLPASPSGGKGNPPQPRGICYALLYG